MDNDLIEIDGSHGEGGGQILRTSLALSMLTQRPIQIRRIRGGREKPGLQRQHLVAVQAAGRISNAELSGAALHSQELTFRPNPIVPGIYDFDIGSAGSTSLVVQTVLPALWAASGSSRLTLHGGTHNPMAPPFEFLDRAFLPLIRKMGPQIRAMMVRPGFYPAGGGVIELSIEPAVELLPLRLLERGHSEKQAVHGVVLNLPVHIAEREVRRVLSRLNWPPHTGKVSVLEEGVGRGNYITVLIESSEVTEVFTGLGRLGVRAETVAGTVAQEARAYLACSAPVGEHLADQLLLPLALAGSGEFLTTTPSLHTTTNITVIETFLQVKFQVKPLPSGLHQISVSRLP